MKLQRALTLILLILLASCATLNEDECITADWQAIGYEDGANGLPDSRIGAHREACAKHGITPSLSNYRDGHKEGLISFCTPRNGFNRARNGYQYKGICPPLLEPNFLDGYEAGREIYQAESNVSELEKQQSNNEAEQQNIEQLLQEKEAILFARGTSETRRRAIYEEIAQLKKRQGALEQQRDNTIRNLTDADAWLKELRNRYSYY
ncbi:DUF2799 domain-containing protein [Gilvimarinus polysaccharolyticus]|uniref:DUF2799 domain-containing protein n=1 Tax=Gilvimarinus polysaccharolyticus TaxID=863921 RepID=UPI0006734559|nr:DUF2799 domain-containing protein [Gilvimarinus polysaccharolyticus]